MKIKILIALGALSSMLAAIPALAAQSALSEERAVAIAVQIGVG